MMEKRTLVVFSGGLDSTYLLYKELLKRDVDLITVSDSNSLQFGDHEVAEEIQRKAIISSLNRQTKLFRIRKNYKIQITTCSKATIETVNYSEEQGLVLQNFKLNHFRFNYFISSVLQYINPELHDKVVFGFVKCDQGTCYVPEIKELWKKLWKLQRKDQLISGCSQKRPKLSFPIKNVNKRQILTEALGDENLKSILRLVHYCTKPTKAPDKTYHVCDECFSCRRMQGTWLHDENLKKKEKALN